MFCLALPGSCLARFAKNKSHLCTDTIRRKPYSSPNTVIRHTTYLLYSLCRTILQKKLKAAESRADLVGELRGLTERSQGLSCDDLSDEYLLEILDWAARDRIDKIAGGFNFQRWEVHGEVFSQGLQRSRF